MKIGCWEVAECGTPTTKSNNRNKIQRTVPLQGQNNKETSEQYNIDNSRNESRNKLSDIINRTTEEMYVP